MTRGTRTLAGVASVALGLGLAVMCLARASGSASNDASARAAEPVPQATSLARPSARPRVASNTPNARPRVASDAASDAAAGEAALMDRLRALPPSETDLAIDLAREGNTRFPGSDGAPERASILIHALARKGLASEARGEAEDMVNRYPDSAWVREVEGFTGAHRHRNLRLGANGALEAY
jgi:hypothetical protein